jgi:hypothetical protein
MTRRFFNRLSKYGIALFTCLLAGCLRAPSFDIVGSLFPAWLVCIVFGIMLACVAHWVLLRRRIPIFFPILVYPFLTALLTFLLWLVFFG